MELETADCTDTNGTTAGNCFSLRVLDSEVSDFSSQEEQLSSCTLAFCYCAAALLLACIYCLNRPTFSRYKLGCLLILRWNCAADTACLLNKATFTMVNRYHNLIEGNRHALTWVCKLYHLGENLTMNVQTLLLVLFALERGAIALDLRFGLKHFSQFRLKIGACLAAVVTLAAHINHIWMYSIGLNYSDIDGSTNTSAWLAVYECRVAVEFLEIYHVVAMAELFANVYAPILVCSVSVAIVICRWFRNGLERPSVVFGKAKNGNGNANQINTGVLNCLDEMNRNVKLLHLGVVLVCYLPLAATGLIRAVSVHHKLPVAEELYQIMNYILQPMKNVLSALATTVFVAHHFLATRLRKAKRSRCQRAKNNQSDEEDAIPLRVIG